MCFSATASFVAAGGLATAGVVSIASVKKPEHLAFAVVPLFFAIQQACEGVLWLSFSDPAFSDWNQSSMYLFLSFAHVIWPFWIPMSILLMEDDNKLKRVRWLKFFMAGGALTSGLLLFGLAFYKATSGIENCHVEYDVASPLWIRIVAGIFYVAAIVVAPFFSSRSRIRQLATVNVVSLALTILFFEVWFVSVWCFFAAIQSIIIVLVIREARTSIDMNRTPSDSELPA